MQLMRLVFQANPSLFLCSAFFGLMSGGMGTAILYLINRAANDFSNAQELAIPFGICLVLFLVSEITAQFLVIRISQNSIFTLRNKIISNIVSRPYRASENKTAEILSALSDDVSTITQTVKGIPLLLTNGTLIFGAMLYLVWVSWELSLAFLVAAILGTLALDILRRKAGRRFHRSRKLQDRMFEHFQTIARSLKEFKLNIPLQNAFLREDFIPTAEGFRRSNTSAFTLFLASGSVGRIAFYLLIGVILFGMGSLVSVTATQIASFVFAVIFLKGPIEWTLNWMPALYRAKVALEELRKFGSARGTGELRVPEPEPYPIRKITTSNLLYRYPKGGPMDPFTIGPINLEFKPGIHFLVGGNGSGKTTLAKLLSGLYIPSWGILRINDEISITRENFGRYRQAISAIFQNFSMLKRVNITSDQDRIRVERYLEMFELSEKVRFVGDSFSVVNELSLGQQKRLALVSTLIYDRPVHIFDEWAADQDPRFRGVFYTSILPDLKARGKIVIVISHDEAYYHVADQIIRMEYGRQAAYAPFENLVGQILVRRAIITHDQLESALKEQWASPIQEKLGEVIIRLGYAPANVVRRALVAQLGLGQIFVEMGLISEEQLFLALREQKTSREGTRIGEILVSMGFVSEADIEKALKIKGVGLDPEEELKPVEASSPPD